MITNTEKLPEEFKIKWLQALRSGEYKQGKEALYSLSQGTYCCLGVAGVICGIGADKLAWHSWLDDSGVPNKELVPNAILSSSLGTPAYKLACMNDDGKSFSDIANYIEENL